MRNKMDLQMGSLLRRYVNLMKVLNNLMRSKCPVFLERICEDCGYKPLKKPFEKLSTRLELMIRILNSAMVLAVKAIR